MHDAQFFWDGGSHEIYLSSERKGEWRKNRSLVSKYILKMGQTCQYQMLPIFYFIPKNWSNREKKMKKTKNKAVEKKKSRMWWNMSNKCLFIRRIWGAAQNVTEARFTLCRICLWHIPCTHKIYPGMCLSSIPLFYWLHPVEVDSKSVWWRAFCPHLNHAVRSASKKHRCLGIKCVNYHNKNLQRSHLTLLTPHLIQWLSRPYTQSKSHRHPTWFQPQYNKNRVCPEQKRNKNNKTQILPLPSIFRPQKMELRFVLIRCSFKHFLLHIWSFCLTSKLWHTNASINRGNCSAFSISLNAVRFHYLWMSQIHDLWKALKFVCESSH